MSNKQTIIFYKDWYQLIKSLSDTNKAKLLDLIFDENNSTEINDPHLKSVYDFIKYKIDENNQKYEAQIEKKKIAGIRSGEVRRAKIEDKETQRTHVHFVEQNQTNMNLLYTDPVPDTEYCILNTESGTENELKKENISPKVLLQKKESPKHDLKSFAQDFETLPIEAQKWTVEKYINARKINLSHEQIANWLQEFEKFWQHYTPIVCNGKQIAKGSKLLAREGYMRIVYKEKNSDAIFTGLAAYLSFCKQNNQYTCAVTTFLNQRKWEDDYASSEIKAEIVPKEASYTTNTRKSIEAANEAMARYAERERLKQENQS